MEPEKIDPNTEVLKNIELNGEHSLLQGKEHIEATKNLETPLEGILLKSHEGNKTLETIAENTKPQPPKDVQKVKLELDDPGDLAKAFFNMLRGPKGEDSTVPGPKGEEPSTERLTEIMKPLIPAAIPGPKGEDAKDPTDEHLLTLITGKIPPAIPGPKGEDSKVPGPKGEPGPVGSPDTPEQILEKIKGKLSYADLKDWDVLERFISSKKETTKESSDISSKTYSLREMDDVSMQGIVAGQVLQWDGQRFIPYTPSTSSFTQVFGEVIGTASSAAFTLAHTPIAGSVRIYRGGAYQQGGIGNDYTITGANGTLSSVLATGEILLADYNY